MLTPVKKSSIAGNYRIAVVAAEYNATYVNGLLEECQRTLTAAGAQFVVTRVPGSFEIPAVAAHYATSRKPKFDAVIAFGVIFQGETKHADHIGLAVSTALAQMQAEHKVPVIHGVLLFTNEDQARVRCLGSEHNRGREAAQVALSMARLMRDLRPLR
ncbi:MAG TPA: 6,7-dimethyl-8-ribityllumazine synthase [Methylomirabilota bacterium]|nr:6,7-dimethyl-8-ribityllumazine synthase [Methylomirabilota bacterium]